MKQADLGQVAIQVNRAIGDRPAAVIGHDKNRSLGVGALEKLAQRRIQAGVDVANGVAEFLLCSRIMQKSASRP